MRPDLASGGFVDLARRHPGPLAFGLLYASAGAVGQTFLISLFLPGIKASLGLGEAQASLLFTLATLASAAVLWKLGAWIDRADLLRYALSSALLLALACIAMAMSQGVALLAVGLFLLRLAGNGLLTHVAVTATARHFVEDRGRALAIVMLGPALSEGALPALLVPLIGAWGWRWALAALGVFGLALAGAGALAVRRQAPFRAPSLRTAQVQAPRTQRARARGGRAFFVWTAPLFAAMWVVVTATIFHQALLASAKGLTLHWFAVSFVAFAVVRVPVSILAGKLVDRIGSTPLFCAHVLPLAAGLVALAVSGEAWVAPFFWLCAGVTSGLGTVVQSTLVAERVARERLGKARSLLGAAGIVASAAGPTLYGAAFAAGAGVTVILWGSIIYLLAATALAAYAARERAGIN